jgi:magnesium transporter
MLSYTLFRALTYPITYLLVFVLVFTAIMQIKYVNRALQRFSSTQVIPTQFVMFTLSVIVGSAVLYRDFEKESGEDARKFIGGCALTFSGVWLITSGRKTDEPDEEEFLDDDEEEAIGLVPGQLHGEHRYYDEPETRPKPRRSSTVPGPILEAPIPNGFSTSEGSSEPRRSFESDLEALPTITRTGTGRSVTFVDDEPFVPASSPGVALLTENPWAGSEEHTPKERRSIQNLLKPLSKLFPSQEFRPLPSTLKTTHSAPLLPSEAQYYPRPQTPPNSTSRDNDHLATPQTPDGTLRLARHHSIVDLIPGPFTSTLSSPLSAIVADSLRRGVDVASLKPRRRRKLPGMPQRNTLRERGLSETDARPPPTNSSSSSLPVGDAEQEEATSGVRNRVRSLSNTFGDLFRTIKTPRRGSKPDTETTSPSEPPTPSLEESAFTR